MGRSPTETITIRVTPEEKREREARLAGEAVGAVVGFGIGAVVELTKQKQTPTDDVDDGEDEGFEISM